MTDAPQTLRMPRGWPVFPSVRRSKSIACTVSIRFQGDSAFTSFSLNFTQKAFIKSLPINGKFISFQFSHGYKFIIHLSSGTHKQTIRTICRKFKITCLLVADDRNFYIFVVVSCWYFWVTFDCL